MRQVIRWLVWSRYELVLVTPEIWESVVRHSRALGFQPKLATGWQSSEWALASKCLLALLQAAARPLESRETKEPPNVPAGQAAGTVRKAWMDIRRPVCGWESESCFCAQAQPDRRLMNKSSAWRVSPSKSVAGISVSLLWCQTPVNCLGHEKLISLFVVVQHPFVHVALHFRCLLYTSDAADE